MSATTTPVSVRVSSDERVLLEAAAAQAQTSLSDFIRRKALEAAELELLGRHIVTIPATEWERFEAWAAAPARRIPVFQALSANQPAWQD